MSPTTKVRTYQMRTMPLALLDRIRILAAYDGTTMEQVVIDAIEMGLPSLEAQSRKRRPRERVAE